MIEAHQGVVVAQPRGRQAVQDNSAARLAKGVNAVEVAGQRFERGRGGGNHGDLRTRRRECRERIRVSLVHQPDLIERLRKLGATFHHGDRRMIDKLIGRGMIQQVQEKLRGDGIGLHSLAHA